MLVLLSEDILRMTLRRLKKTAYQDRHGCISRHNPRSNWTEGQGFLGLLGPLKPSSPLVTDYRG